ncbi:hypothetical protein IFR05_004881 [Cadophora sp. M221]|nr:hypothetical protein IFR05_004881 [Cadophora sp. M221]
MNNVSFNWCFKVVSDDGTKWAVRFPVAGRVVYPDEKVRREVAVMRFLREKTLIPVPEVIAFGMAADNHDPKMVPFIIEEWIDGVPLSTIIEKLPRPSLGPVLRKDISDETLHTIYLQIAKILLELSMHNFDKIGAPSLVKHEDGTTSWPITNDVTFAISSLLKAQSNSNLTDSMIKLCDFIGSDPEYSIEPIFAS